MKFLADECCDAPLVKYLRENGHDVLYQMEENAGVEDEDVLIRAYQEKRILLSEDKDFGELIFRLRKRAVGIVLLRIDVKERDMKWPRLKKLIDVHRERLPGYFVVVERDKIRFRPLFYEL